MCLLARSSERSSLNFFFCGRSLVLEGSPPPPVDLSAHDQLHLARPFYGSTALSAPPATVMSDSRQDPPSPQEEAHPDPPSPTLPPRTTTMQNADASSSSSQPAASLPSSSSGGVGDVGVNGSGRQRFYDALRRIGFPRIPALSPRAGAGGASAPPLGPSTTSNDVAGANPSEVPHQAAVPSETVEAVPTSGTPSVDSAPVFGPPPPPSMPAQGQPFVGLGTSFLPFCCRRTELILENPSFHQTSFSTPMVARLRREKRWRL